LLGAAAAHVFGVDLGRIAVPHRDHGVAVPAAVDVSGDLWFKPVSIRAAGADDVCGQFVDEVGDYAGAAALGIPKCTAGERSHLRAAAGGVRTAGAGDADGGDGNGAVLAWPFAI